MDAINTELRSNPFKDQFKDGDGDAERLFRISFDMQNSNNMHRYHDRNSRNIRRALQNMKKIDEKELEDFQYQVDYSKPLTVREFEILYLASKGLSNPQIGETLSISSHTVKSHFDHIFNKLGVANRTMAVLWAVRHGLTP